LFQKSRQLATQLSWALEGQLLKKGIFVQIFEISIKNLRSIVDSGDVPIQNLFALVGENNAGKSNVTKAIDALLSGGAGGLKKADFYDESTSIIIKGSFKNLTDDESNRWKKYLTGGKLVLEKHIWVEDADTSAGQRLKSEYHGYESEPVDWFLSIPSIIEEKGQRPKWLEIAQENGLPDYFYPAGKSGKAIYAKALEKFLVENEVEFQEPDLSATHALGLQSNVVASLPSFYLLPAITDYSDEIDKRQNNSTFRKLMGELSERIIKNDPKFIEIESSLAHIHGLLNSIGTPGTERLEALGVIEDQIGGLLNQLMPSVNSVSISVAVTELKEIFSSGVSLSVNDGIDTDVLAKGHGLQRCIVFSLLKALIDVERNAKQEAPRPIILVIEEPELYIHPQLSKLFFDVMREFSETDQVIYTTHSPIFVDAYLYKDIAIVSKLSVEIGTKLKTASGNSIEELQEAKIFKGLSRFNPSVSELFFAKRILIVEGPEDLIAVNAILSHAELIKYRAEELEWSILVAGGKDAIPFFQRVANEFSIPYSVLYDIDIKDGMSQNTIDNHQKVNDLIIQLAGDNPIHTFPIKLEESLGLDFHLKDQYRAHEFFSEPNNITEEVKNVVLAVFN
jgi:putative ATP-dependent endonuclease of OLD family